MFTGIVSSVGRLERIERKPVFTVQIRAKTICAELRLGDSVAVNGVCLSATEIDGDAFAAELSAETLAKTTFGDETLNKKVNLELPLRLSDRLGGHLVQGHVDAVCEIVEVRPKAEFRDLFFSIPAGLEPYLIPKGSVTLNGASLTISHLKQSSFGVSLIPATLKHTNLSDLKPGDRVNMEADMMAKYVESLMKKTATH